MNVGILTFHKVPNYGAYLQAYCLAEAIRSHGHQVKIINYKNRNHYASERLKFWVYRRPWKLWHDFKKHRAINRAMDWMPLTQFTTDPTRVDWNAFEAIVVGSDIVWNCEDQRLGRDPVFFGRFPVPFRGRLVAYAPSIGSMDPGYVAQPWVGEALRRFHAVYVRDKNTQEFVRRQIGEKVPLVADPTWLVRTDRNLKGGHRSRTDNGFLLVYSFPIGGKLASAAASFAQLNKLRTVAVGYPQGWCDENWGDVDPFEWVSLFSTATYVLTGTFHGTLYSIRENARFCTLSHSSIDSKVITPLSVTGLCDRQTSDPESLVNILTQPIDFELVNNSWQSYGAESLDFLRKALA